MGAKMKIYRSTDETMSEAIWTAGREAKETVRIGAVLEELINGILSQRIAEAARLSAARHMVHAAQEVRSAVETEISAT
jgi:hypothetical protein